MDTEETQELVHVKDLTFNYFEKKVLYDLSLDLCRGSGAWLLVLTVRAKVHCFEYWREDTWFHRPVSSTCLEHVHLRIKLVGWRSLGNNWSRTVAFAASNVAYQCDIPVRDMMSKLQRDYPERRDMLVKLLGVDLDWRIHQVSDRQRQTRPNNAWADKTIPCTSNGRDHCGLGFSRATRSFELSC